MNTEAPGPTNNSTDRENGSLDGSSAGTVRVVVPATYADVRTIDAAVIDLLARAGGVDAETCSGVELAVHEIATNIVDHAYAGAPADRPGRIVATAALTGMQTGGRRRLVIELEDTGAPFDPAAVPPVNLDVPQEGGYGLFLAEALLDEVHYTRRASANVWRLVKTLPK
jgi:anti-sigma regulatory factor (Ser/Thr protein kinase)